MGIVKKFYDFLAEGRIMGFKCVKCSAYIFPPKAICPSCLGRDLEWTEMSGKGMLLCFTRSEVPAIPFSEYAPYAYGLVKLSEGPVFFSMVEGVDVSDKAKITEQLGRLPIPVKAKIKKVGELNVVTFEVE